MNPITKELVKVVDQYSDGAITYAEMMRKIYLLLPPPCLEVETDTIYAPLDFAMKFICMADEREKERY